MSQPTLIQSDDWVDFSDEQLAKLAEVSDADIEKAKLLWRQNVSEEVKDLLDAEILEEDNA